MIKNNKKNGFVFIEILIAIALFSIAFVFLLGVGALSLNLSNSIQKETQADSLIKEEFEALRNYRDGTTWATTGLGAVNTDGSTTYYLRNNSGNWTLLPQAGQKETAGIFTRWIVFDKAYRDADGKISSSGIIESDAIKVTITVSWPGKSLQTISYLTNWK